jgi:murein DD-endopeptidase MepM/ murein hydrolase activator NlpD
VLARVREAANWDGNLAQNPAVLASALPTTLAAYAPERHDPYAGFEPRIVPENVSLLPKTTAQVTGGNAWNERTIVLKKGDSVSAFLREMGATPDEIKAITAAFGGRGKDSSPRDGYKLRVLLAPASDGIRLRPVRVVIATDTAVEAIVAWSELGKYVSVDARRANSVASSSSDEDDDDGKGVRLYQSIYETGLRNHVPRSAIDKFIRIYSYDVDFQRKVQPGDSFEILYAGEDENPSDNSKVDVWFASLTTGGETKKFYRYQTTDDNLVDYYDESGKSAKKFLVRKPVAEGNMTSGFGGRNHPLLGYEKMHTGVDWASSTGTPVFAAGNGVIDKIGWEGGYGKYIRLRHANGYETAYGHMSAFARGMEAGKKVRQGQVIGYIGSTGLSTGSHLHYEILINGRFVDPMKIRLPRGRVLAGTLLATFDQERTRVDAMMTGGTPSRYAQTR